MKAAVIHKFGPPDVFCYEDVLDPKPAGGELLIQVGACGINRYDLYLRMGALFADIAFPHVLGADVAGPVAALGPGVSGWREGDRAIVAPGYPIDPADADVRPENRAPSFEVTGTHTPEHGGPVREDEKSESRPARYAGRLAAGRMALTVTLTDTGDILGTFALTQGVAGRLTKCL